MSNKLTDIKYVVAEVIKKSSKDDAGVEIGALMGICRRPDHSGNIVSFITLVISDTQIRMYNLLEYDILSIDVLNADMRYLTVYTLSPEDQKAAISRVDELVAILGTDNRLLANDPQKELIDVDSFTDLPKDLFLQTSKPKTTSTTSTTTHPIHHGTTFNRQTTVVDTKPPEPTVTVFKRKGKLPAPEKLQSMRDRVILLKAGEVNIVLPIPECDKKKELVCATVVNTEKKTWCQ